MRTTTNSPSALGAFVSRKAEIDAMLERLKNLSEDHFGFGPEEVHWGHVGQLADYASLLRRIADSAFNEGEHSR
jgi:hypothetical protein